MDNTTLLCGSQPFWDLDLTWNTNQPSFTRCFRRTAFSLIPNAILWGIAPLYIYKLRKESKVSNHKLALLSIVKILLAVLLVLISLIDLSFWAISDQMLGIDIMEAIVRFVTFVALILLIKMEAVYGIRVSKVQFFFWTILVICHFFNSFCEVMDHFFRIPDIYDHLMPVVTGLAMLSLVFASFICHFFVDIR